MQLVAHSLATPALTRFMLALTFIGTNGFMAVVGAMFVWWLIRTSRVRDAIWLIALQISANLLLQILKFAFHRPRPVPFFGLTTPDSYSFPERSRSSFDGILFVAGDSDDAQTGSPHRRRAACFAHRIFARLPRRPLPDRRACGLRHGRVLASGVAQSRWSDQPHRRLARLCCE